MDLRQTKNYANYLAQTGWIIEKIDKTRIFIRKIPFTPFSIIKLQHPEKIPDFKKINHLIKKYHSFSTYIEPMNKNQESRIKNQGYKPYKSPFLPAKTIKLDLTLSEQKILAQMKKDARYSIRKTEKKQTSHYNALIYYKEAKTNDDLKNFYKAFKKTTGLKLIIPPLKNILALKKAFGKNSLFLTSCLSNEIIAGTIVLFAHHTACYFYAFTNKKGRKLKTQYGLVWEAIKIAKKRRCKIFDFEGIYDSRFPQKSWLGFTHFKKSFGGKEVNYPGCFKKNYLIFLSPQTATI